MKRPEKNVLEWTVFGVSAALILGIAGWLLYAHVAFTRLPPRFEIASGAPVLMASGYAVPLTVSNVGDTSASLVRVEVLLRTAAGSHRSDAEIDLIPYRSKRRVWVTFPVDPAGGELAARVIAFEEP